MATATQTTIDIGDKLARRGLLDVAARAGWRPYTLRLDDGQYTGWAYPVHNKDGNPYDRPRWKSADDTGPRYYWPKGKPKAAKYYFLPGLLTAIQQADGQVYIAAGEPDVLAYHAAGLPNTFCWLASEEAVPDTLVSDLRIMGARSVVYAPDLDAAGMRAAAKVYRALSDAGMPCHIARLPGEMGSKCDINQHWIDCEFDKDKFFLGVWQQHVDLIDLELHSAAPARDVQQSSNEWFGDWVNEIIKGLGAPDGREGGLDRWRCPVPGRHARGDQNPSLRISADQKPDHPWPVCSCDIQRAPDPWSLLADALGLPSWSQYKATRAAEEYGVKRGEDGKLATIPGKAPIVNMDDVYSDLASVLLGDKAPDGVPMPFPYTTLHRFGGFAEWMWTGKAVAVGGISGGGKTLLLRVLFNAMLNAGYDMIWWGPEFSPTEYGIQDLIRSGGLTFKQVNPLLVVRGLQHKHGIGLEEAIKRSGLSVAGQAAIDESVAKLQEMRARRGKLFVINDLKRPVEHVMQMATGWANARRDEGREVGGIGWDYLQLSNMPGKRDWTWGERIVNTIKNGCAPSEGNMVAFVGTQTRKNDAEKVRAGEKTLKVGDGQGVDEKFFNLYLTLTPAYLNERKQDWAILSVEKNSMGDTGKVALHANWSRLMIADKENKDVNLEGYLGG
jgi:hypothetical protein